MNQMFNSCVTCGAFINMGDELISDYKSAFVPKIGELCNQCYLAWSDKINESFD